MRIYISADIEGITGVVHGDQCNITGAGEYQRARLQMTREVSAAAQGFFNSGASEVICNDSHGSMRNIMIEELHPEVRLISGSPKHLSMMEGISDQFDAVAFIGYHAKNGDRGVLSHTISGGTVFEIRINGKPASEAVINAAIAGDFNVPVILLTGDQTICNDVKQNLGKIETVTVKEAITRYSALNLPTDEACQLIEAAAKRAYGRIGELKPFIPSRPVNLELVCLNSGLADNASRCPGSERIDGRTLRCSGNNFLEAFRILRTMIALAN